MKRNNQLLLCEAPKWDIQHLLRTSPRWQIFKPPLKEPAKKEARTRNPEGDRRAPYHWTIPNPRINPSSSRLDLTIASFGIASFRDSSRCRDLESRLKWFVIICLRQLAGRDLILFIFKYQWQALTVIFATPLSCLSTLLGLTFWNFSASTTQKPS